MMRLAGQPLNIVLYHIFLLALYTFYLVDGCGQRSGEFALPNGSYENGKISFVGLNCHSCHSVADIEWVGVPKKDVHVVLGGPQPNIKTYPELITSIINPSHKIARDFKIQTRARVKNSPMSNYNEVMTVQELVDIVTFLGEEYSFDFPTPLYELW